jgi:hypothetical protein
MARLFKADAKNRTAPSILIILADHNTCDLMQAIKKRF